jgi:prepilin-type N-terminal cleavage/methylation domain-containing protein
MNNQETRNQKYSIRGFTIVEMMVAVALFAVVMIIAVGALLSLVTANRKAQALQSVMNNLNTTVDGMVRSIREGSTYHCGAAGSITAPQECLNGTPPDDTYLAFESYGGDPHTATDQYVYQFVASAASCGEGYTGGCIKRSTNGGTTPPIPITAPEVNITSMTFYVAGTTAGDTTQPKVVIVIKGVAGGTNTKITSTFHIQATAVQRVLDLL